jgi:hypothetical protein
MVSTPPPAVLSNWVEHGDEYYSRRVVEDGRHLDIEVLDQRESMPPECYCRFTFRVGSPDALSMTS